MPDLELESNRNMVLFFRSELRLLKEGRKVDRNTLRILMAKRLVIQNRPFRREGPTHRLTDLAEKLLEELTP